MVHEEFIESPLRNVGGTGGNRPSGPLILEPAVLDRPNAEKPPSALPPEETSVNTLATGSVTPASIPPWQAAAHAKGRKGYFLAKRCLDFSLALLCIVLLSPVMLITALLVRLTSRGPAFFRQERVGYGGRTFIMYKFRSMYLENDESLHRLAYEQFLRGERLSGKVDAPLVGEGQPKDAARAAAGVGLGKSKKARKPSARDPRVTPLGNFLRRSSIDELPQFFNVLRGDMSLVGPRPPISYEVRLYQPQHLGRLDTLPGVTGFWQVHGRSRVSFERMVQMDLEYIQKQSFWYDLKLLVLTIPAVLNRKGAY